MKEQPLVDDPDYKAAGKLQGKIALITGGDSGIGQAVAVAFAKEGAAIAIAYLEEDTDAAKTSEMVKKYRAEFLSLRADIGDKQQAKKLVQAVKKRFGQIDILVNNAAEQHPQGNITDISQEQLLRTYRSNIFSMFYLSSACLKHMGKDGCIINTTSVTAYRGSPHLLDYSSTKGAIVSFTRSLSGQLAQKGIRVNAVAPGPIWTPLIPSTFPPDDVAQFGQDVPMGRAGQPSEVAPAFVFLASTDASYITGQVIHVNGGEVVNA